MNSADREKLTKQRWGILLAGCIINLLAGSSYIFSVLAGPMAIELAVASLAIAFTVQNGIGPIPMVLGGFSTRRFGLRPTLFVGGLFFGIGMILSGFAVNTTMFCITYGICMGIGLSFLYGNIIGNSVKLFPDKRGLAGGLATAAYGISSVIFSPIANSMIQAMGVRSTLKILGIISLVVICIAACFVKAPYDGFYPEGFTPPAQVGNANAIKDKKWNEMLKDKVFYPMFLLLICGGVFGLMIISSASMIAQNMIGVSVTLAATFVSVLSLFNTAGRIVAGNISDRIGRINTLTLALIIAMIGLVFLLSSGTGDTTKFVIGIALLGICFGTFMGVFPGFCTDRFGAKYNTINYGIMWIGFAVAGVIGPIVVSNVYQSTGAYKLAFIIALALAVVGLFASFVYRLFIKK